MANVIVGCKLPNGLIIESPIDPSIKVELNGSNREIIIGAGYGSTEVDAEFWKLWESQNKDFPPFKSQAIFVAKSAPDVAAKAKELVNEKTDLEPLRTDGKDRRASGVKKADKE